MCCNHRAFVVRISLCLVFCFNQAQAAEQDLTQGTLLELLAERDAAIIQLQHTVKQLMVRMEVVERSVDPDSLSHLPVPEATARAPKRTAAPNGFASLEVDEQAAQRALERTLIQGGSLLLPRWRMHIAPSVVFTHNQAEHPAVIAIGDEQFLGSNAVKRATFDANLELRVGLPFDSQIEFGIPYRWVDEETVTEIQGVTIGQSDSRNGHGTGSFKVGLAKTLLHENGWLPDIVGRLTWNSGSGSFTDDDAILGGGLKSFGGSLSFTKRSDPLVFLASANYRTYSGKSGVEPGDQFGLSFGTALAVSPSGSLFATVSNQFVGRTTLGGDRVDGSDFDSVMLNLGASTVLSKRVLFSLTTGIGLSEKAPDYSIALSASIQSDALVGLFYR